MNNNPKISVVMSAYNRPQYAKEAIESILNQTYKDFEFIIIDDCSTDNTANVIQEYANKDDRIVFIKNKKNMDYNYNLRKGFEMAKGEYIARMDDDDISMPTRFEKQVKFMDENPDITVLGTFIEIFGNPDVKSWITLTDSDELAIAMNFYNPMCHPSVMIRKSFLREHNLNYSPKELYAEEYHLWKEIILRGGKLANLPETLVSYRCHKKSVTQANKTGKIQNKTAERVREDLLNRFYNNKKEVKKIRKSIFKYPFEFNNKKIIGNVLEKMKQYPQIIPADAINRFEEKFCGKPCTMDIFFASDDKFSQHLCTAMASILVNSLSFENFRFYVLDGGISNKNKAKIEKIKQIKDCKIEYIKIDDSLFDICPITPECQHISKQTYYRYLIPKLKPELEKCFYFDCDIVVKNSLNEFWNTDIEDNYIAAIEELWEEAHTYYENNGISKSFNAGVILINNQKWIKNNISKKLFENTKILVENQKIRWVDQDVLNYTLNGKVKFVHPKCNLQQTAYFDGQYSLYTDQEINEAKAHPIIIHYSGNLKPWNKTCLHPLWKKYFKYLKFTPYKNQYYKYKINKFLKEFGRIFYYKKKADGKTKIKFFGIPVLKETNWDYTKRKYLFGIRFYKKKDNFTQIKNDLSNIIAQNTKLIEENKQLKYAISNEVSKSLAVYNLHQKVFPKYKNINQGKDVVIVATGPSLNDYIPIKDAIHIGVNAACLQDKIKLDYLFVLDYKNIKPYIKNVINYRKNECKKFCGIFMNHLDSLNIPDNVAQQMNAERYYLSYNAFDYDENYYPDITISPLPSFWSTTFQALVFALWTNPKRLYIVGCDNTFGKRYDGTKRTVDNHLLEQHIIKIDNGWKALKEFTQIYYPDIEIISINPVGLKGVFKDEYQKETIKTN